MTSDGLRVVYLPGVVCPDGEIKVVVPEHFTNGEGLLQHDTAGTSYFPRGAQGLVDLAAEAAADPEWVAEEPWYPSAMRVLAAGSAAWTASEGGPEPSLVNEVAALFDTWVIAPDEFDRLGLVDAGPVPDELVLGHGQPNRLDPSSRQAIALEVLAWLHDRGVALPPKEALRG